MTNNKQTAMDDYGNVVSYFALKEEPVWNKGFVFTPCIMGGKEFAHKITGSGMKGWSMIPV
jgi:hypothetical protein